VPIYGSPYGAGSTEKKSGYFGEGGTGGGQVYNSGPAPTPATQSDTLHGPGSIDANLLDPQGTVNEAAKQTGDVWEGLKNFLFGSDVPGTATGKRGGLVGDIPGVGDLGRGAFNLTSLPAHLLGTAVGNAGGLLERIPAMMGPTGDAQAKAINDAFDALPDTSPAKQEAIKKIEEDTGIVGGSGFLTGHLSYMSQAIQKAKEEEGDTSLGAGLFRPMASLADAFTNLFGVLGAGQRVVERGIAGAARADGMNQLQMVVAVGNGEASWTADDPGLTPVEQQAFEQYTSGNWTEDQALNFLSSHGAGLAHNKALEIAGSFATDPLTVGGFGASALAKVGKVGMALLDAQKEAEGLLAAARAAGDTAEVTRMEQAIKLTGQGIRAGETPTGKNILAKVAQQDWTGRVATKFGAAYGALEGNNYGRMAKTIRTIIDPFHDLGGKPHVEQAIEEGARQVPEAVVNAHGQFTNIEIGHHLNEIDGVGRELLGQYTQGLATYSGHVLKRVAGRAYRTVQMLGVDKGEGLMGVKLFDGLRDAMKAVSKRTMTQLEEEAGKFIKRVWSEEDDANLAQRLETLWGGRTKEQWLEEFKKTELGKTRWTAEKKSLLHSATYGSAIKQLHEARLAARAAGYTGKFADRLHELILINKTSLTDLGAQGILDRLAAAEGSVDSKLAEIAQAQRDYPELRNFVHDPTSEGATIQNFVDMLERRKNFLPGQIADAERAGLSGHIADFDAKTRNIFTIGFRPKDEFLWGVERDSDGVLREVGDPWFDQVSDVPLAGYMPVHEASFNVAGRTIVGQVVKHGARMIDAAEAAGRVAMHGVTGRMIETAAHTRFVQRVSAKFESAGLSSSQAEGLWGALMDKVNDTENISGVRGLSRDAIWNAGKSVIRPEIERAGLDRRTLLVHVMDAYNGDLRQIGLTQKFTGKTKLLMAQLTGANTTGQVAEHLWPLLRFRLNGFFQLQEKIEPWVLNAQRGITPARGVAMNAVDRETLAIYKNFVDKGLVNMADNDIAELARKFNMGKGLEEASRSRANKIGYIREKLESITEVQGVKQLNMLRTWRKGLGKDMRAVWEANSPGEWDKMLLHARGLAGGALIDEDEFAVRLAAENLASNDIAITEIKDAAGNVTSVHADFRKAITTGQWSAPQSLGELRPIHMDQLVADMGLRDNAGRDLTTSMELRAALADRRIAMEDVERNLRDLNAHGDFVARVRSDLTFSHRQFWSDVQNEFNLTDAERSGFENFYAGIARRRGMTPAEYLSQVYSPNISRNGEHAVGSLGALVEATRGGRFSSVPDLARLAGREGQANIHDLYSQMGAIMSAHLDPSAKRAFLLDLNPQLVGQAQRGEILSDLDDIAKMWAEQGTDALSERIMHFVQGQPGSGAHTLVADETTGVAKIRDAATQWRTNAGRPRNTQRTIHEDNPALAQEVAQATEDMPRSFTHVATPVDLAYKVEPQHVSAVAVRDVLGLTGTKAEYAALGTTAKSAYRSRILEGRKLYRYLTETMGVEVKPVRAAAPYATADALRADLARGRLKVAQSGYWHPIINNEDLFMEQAVHDAFGYGQEANALGSHDATFNAIAMYGDEARSSLISDNFGRQAWEAHSNEVIQQAVAEPKTVAEYEATYGKTASQQVHMPASVTNTSRWASRSVGNGVRALPEPVQQEIIGHLGFLRNQFPTVPFEAIDVAPLPSGTGAATLQYHLEQPTIALGTDAGWQADDVARNAKRVERLRNPNVTDRLGRQFTVSNTPQGDLYHEWGHVVDIHLQHQFAAANPGVKSAERALHEPLDTLMDQFRRSPAIKKLSKYAHTGPNHGELGRSESFAELFDLAFNPDHEDFILSGAMDPELQSYVNAFRKELKNAGVWKSDGVVPKANPNAGKTVAEVNAAAPGTIRAEHRTGLLPQELTDRLTENFLGSGRFAESNPDVARMAGFLQDHMRDYTEHVLRNGEAGDTSGIFNAMNGMPVSDPVPYDLTQAQMWNAAVQSMSSKWEDAFRLQYFAQKRSMFQRSLNHPMFGLYPASYMWGKIGPELLRFIATEPFGMNTGALGKSLLDIQKAVAVQRTYDPGFEETITDLGDNAALSFLGYMLPALPWDIPSSYPGWMRALAQQGLDSRDALAANGTPEEPDFSAPLRSVIDKTFPYTTTVPWFFRAVDALPWNAEAPAGVAPGTKDAMGNIVQAAPAAPAPDLSRPVVGQQDLQPVLEQQMRDLQALLGR
jgi:hypothetical protein